MITQVDTMRFKFPMIKREAECKYGDDPYLDSLGAVSHLLPHYDVFDKEAMRWVASVSHNLVEYDMCKLFLTVNFENVEDAIYFKMRWIIGDE